MTAVRWPLRAGAAALCGVVMWWAWREGIADRSAVVDVEAPAEGRAAADPPAAWAGPAPAQWEQPAAMAQERAETQAEAVTLCPGRRITLAREGRPPEAWCAAPTRTSRTGEILAHEVEPSTGAPGWKLRIETGAGEVVRVLLTGPGGQRFGCSRDTAACAVAPLPPEAGSAVERIALQGALLLPWPPQRPKGLRAADLSPAMFLPDPAARPVRVSAELELPAAASGQAACTGPGVMVVSSQGAVTPFCGEAGHEQGLLPGGGERVGFLAHASPPLRVDLNPAGQVLRIELGALACEAAACNGAAVEAGAPGVGSGPRSLTLAGTALLPSGQAGSAESVVLSGSLPLP